MKPIEKKIGESRFINRELSWLKFNERVLFEAESPENPLLERLKFLAIFESNLDEFYMVRVSGLIEQESRGRTERTPDGLTPTEQLLEIAKVVPMQKARAGLLLNQVLLTEMRDSGLSIDKVAELAANERKRLREFFKGSVFPLCTPLLLDPCITFPFISNRSLNLAVELEENGRPCLARVKIPPNISRVVPVPGKKGRYVLLEDLIAENLDLLFSNVKIQGHHLFRVIRDADVEIREIEAADLIAAVEESLSLRRLGDPVLLEYESSLDDHWVSTIRKGLELDESDCICVDGPLALDFLWELYGADRPDLKYPPFHPKVPAGLESATETMATVRFKDVLLHHPYDSFRPVENFVASAAIDPSIVGIKMTLYRVGSESPIVQSLLAAAEAGKQVAAMVELKARFDENNNLVWSRALERAGVHVSYGFRDMKVHCKLCLVVKMDKKGKIQTFAHIGTGNYNPQTALVYTDFGFLTSDPDICQDVSELFNLLTGMSNQTGFRKLLVSPHSLREEILERIKRETTHGVKGVVIFKLNSLVDPEVVDALYEASQAGVDVKLAVRGVCCLRPGVPGMSEGIEVVSLVGRFLEHSRAYYFGNDGDPELWIGSADMMRRNLDRRIEVLVPVSDRGQIKQVRDEVLLPHFKDTVRSWRLRANGEYSRFSDGQVFSLQEHLLLESN
ncbi:MAG: polyphosphate kinase 1 [Chthonomonadaceae bacterium]|nr:polyphosphate kinase 1 [Chthonomonadaceae bacterium]